MRRLTMLAGLVALAGCAGDFTWHEVVPASGTSAGHSFRWRNTDELWSFGDAALLRRVGGTWQQLSVCDLPDPEVAAVSFDGDEVWVLCGEKANPGQTLVEGDGSAATTEVALPDDGDLTLVPMLNGVALRGDHNLFVRTGSDWKATALPAALQTHQHPLGGNVDAEAGRSASEIYVENEWWNGHAWATWTGGAGGLELIDGGVWSGAAKVANGHATPVTYAAATEVKDRDLGLTAIGPDGVGIFAASDSSTTFFWRAAPGDAALTYLGSGPFLGSSFLGGGGVSNVFALDADTLVVEQSNGSTEGLGGAGAMHLWEGDR